MIITTDIKQKYTSVNTSINTVNGIYKKIVGKYPLGTSILDLGCGRYDSNKDFADENGFVWFGIDPYNRTQEYNDTSLNALHRWCKVPKIIMINNVLNVVAEDSVLENILSQAYNYADDNTDIYITIYEGDKSGIGKVTTKGYQRNQKVNEYIDYINKFFEVAEKIGGNILKVRKVCD